MGSSGGGVRVECSTMNCSALSLSLIHIYAEEDYAIGMAKNSPLEDAVNSVLEELKADGTLQAIVDKYITAE